MLSERRFRPQIKVISNNIPVLLYYVKLLNSNSVFGLRAPQPADDGRIRDEQQNEGDSDATQQSDWSNGVQRATGTASCGVHGGVPAQYTRWVAAGPGSGQLHKTHENANRKMWEAGCNQSNGHPVSQELMNENKDLQVQNEKMQAQISSQVPFDLCYQCLIWNHTWATKFPLI